MRMRLRIYFISILKQYIFTKKNFMIYCRRAANEKKILITNFKRKEEEKEKKYKMKYW